MNAKLTALSFTTLALTGAVLSAIACGSTPKPEPDTAATVAPPSSAAPKETETPPAQADAAAPAAAGMSEADCEALQQDAQSSMDAEQIQVDKQCKKDADCMPVKARACQFVCENAAIPKSEEKDWTDTLKKVMDGPCKKWTENECEKKKSRPAPTCEKKTPKCQAGHCVLR